MIRHAGLIATRRRGEWCGVLIEGPSGAGKSDLALRALDHGFRLVADDRVMVWACDGRLWGRAPDTLSGLIEARGLGVIAMEPLRFSRIDLVARIGAGERIPGFATETILGIDVPLLAVSALESSAPAKLSRAMTIFDAAHNEGI